jgi:hypothetical protein
MKVSGGRLAVSWKAAKVGAALVLAIGLSGCYYPYGYYGNGYYGNGYYGNYGYGYYRPNGPYAYQPYQPYYYSR